MERGAPPTRRQVLGSLGAAALGGLAGCSSLLWPGEREPDQEQVALTIKTMPADDDEIAASILSQLRKNFTAAGIDTTQEQVTATKLYRDILVDQEYDVFVTRAKVLREPDTLRRLLHSDFRSEEGWQNPFNFSDVTVDTLLEKQLQTDGEEREEHLGELIELLGRTAPFTVVAFPDHRNGRRTSLPDTTRSGPNRAVGYLELLSREPSGGPWSDPLRVGLSGAGFTSDLNPIGVDSGRVNPLTGLLYDPLVRYVDGEYVPWLAEDVSWEETDDRLRATVDLRDGLAWHDGESLTADDVAFTLEFLDDTSLGGVRGGIPAPRFRGRQTAIASADRIDSTAVEFAFETPARSVARNALTIPLLPEHVWKSRAEAVGTHETEARTTANENPIGSGLLRFDERSEGESITFDVFDEHALLDSSVEDRPHVLRAFPQYDGVEFRVVPVHDAFPEMLAEAEVDITGTPLSSDIADRIDDETEAVIDRSQMDTMYLVGYNLYHPQLGLPRFRSLLSRLVDREYVVEEFFDGHGFAPETYGELVGIPGEPPTSSDERTIPPFPGSDGEIDVDQVRRLFESNGYRYVDGNLHE